MMFLFSIMFGLLFLQVMMFRLVVLQYCCIVILCLVSLVCRFLGSVVFVIMLICNVLWFMFVLLVLFSRIFRKFGMLIQMWGWYCVMVVNWLVVLFGFVGMIGQLMVCVFVLKMKVVGVRWYENVFSIIFFLCIFVVYSVWVEFYQLGVQFLGLKIGLGDMNSLCSFCVGLFSRLLKGVWWVCNLIRLDLCSIGRVVRLVRFCSCLGRWLV